MQRRRALGRLFLLLAGLPFGDANFNIDSIESRPSYGYDVLNDRWDAMPPTDWKKHALTRDGFVAGVDSSVNISRFTHIGCFEADFGITHLVSDAVAYDPNECMAACKIKFEGNSTGEMIVAVHQDRCGCVLSDMSTFREVPQSFCTYYCKYYRNPICGGFPDYWGVFREFDFVSLTGQGAYDPWRYIWYSLVAIRESNIRGGIVPDGVQPERYFLHAVDVVTGAALYQFQMPVNGILYGLQYDLDGSRLIALHTESDTGRINPTAQWRYKLARIIINTTFEDQPRLSISFAQLNIRFNESEQYLQFSGASGILSQSTDIFVITQCEPAQQKKDMKDHIYFIRIQDGFIVYDSPLDFKVLQIFTNEKWGDVTVLGPRMYLGFGIGSMSYIYLARVYRDMIEERTVVDFQYNPINPTYVAPVENTQDYHIYPGVAVSEHLFNYSAIAHRRSPYPDQPQDAAFIITEVNIRTGQMRDWCNTSLTNDICVGTIDKDIPYAALYNQEPGIPLSLKAPSFTDARFTMEAGTIIVNFDRATLQGAVTKDDNNDFLPDRIDYSTQPDGLFDCGLVFTPPTILLLGRPPDTQCIWMTDSRIQINLPSVINISVGDSLFVLPDTIYTIPRPPEWSPAALGGVQVEPPDPLEPPVIVLTGSTNLDACTDVRLVGVDSFQTGKLPRYRWALQNGTQEDPNPKDLTNNPNRIIDTEKVQLVKEALAVATEFNMATLEMPSIYLEAATTYKMMFSVTSRWGLTTTKEVLLTKLNFPAPMVSINGPAEISRRRPDRITLEAVGIPSACANASGNLGYRWVASSGNLNLADYPEIITNAAALTIPPFVLEPDLTNVLEYNVYNFTVECFVNTIAGDVPERTAYARVTVKIYRSTVYVVYRTASRMVTKGDILVLDVRGSQDPDYPTLEGQTFRGTFVWSCFTPERLACFGGSATGVLEDLVTCRQDIGTQIQDGGVTFFAPLFDDLIFCRYTRGVLMLQTQNFTNGEYKFTVQATSYDGRQAQEDVFITMTDVQVPKILLTIADQKAKYPVSIAIQISGTEEGNVVARRLQLSNEARRYTWTVLAYYPNPEYDPDLAQERMNDPNNPYTVDQFTYVDQSDRFDTNDQRLFRTDPSLPNIIIQPNVLQPSTKYKLRLNIHLTNVTGFSDIVIETAGLPPRGGRLEVTPRNESMDTPRVVSAPDWVATDLPLTYSFGYIKFVEGNPLDAAFSADPQQVSSKALSRLVLGEPSNNYTLYLYVEVYTPYGAKSRATVAVQSLPVQNNTQAAIDGLDAAENADASNLVNNLDYVLSLDPADNGTQQAVLDLLEQNSDQLPTTPSQLQSQALLYSDLVANGQESDQLLDQVERLVQTSANSGAITLDGNLAGVYFDIFGNLMPGSTPSVAAATPGSTRMKKYSQTNAIEKGMPGKRRSNLHFRYGATRMAQNHPEPLPYQYILTECDTAFCDVVGLACSPEDFEFLTFFTCCNARNSDTLCNEPPCWFHGAACPVPTQGGSLAGVRRMQASSRAHKKPLEEGWFDTWKNHNMPSIALDESEVSEYDRQKIYTGWHPNAHERKLLFARGNLSQSLTDRVLALGSAELPLLRLAVDMTSEAARNAEADYIKDATDAVAFKSMTPAIAAKLESDKRAQEQAAYLLRWQTARNASQRITRLNVMRDTVSKSLLTAMQTALDPLTFSTTAYAITIGKTTNLTSVNPAFSYPEAFQVPPDSRDFITPTNPFTRFAYIYVEYFQNVYDWSDSNPYSTENQLITLYVLKGSTLELDEATSTDWIRVFADRSLLANVVCLWWDRFAPGTAGGRWSSQGVVNDDTGCITSHITGDFAIFMDGRTFSGYGFVEAATHWEREVWVSNCIGCGDESNLTVVAVLGMLLFALILLILLTYTLDESQRTQLAQNKVKSRYYYDGNGITSPLSIDDPIAYHFSEGPLLMLWLGTLWNVAKRDHALLSTMFYHETFTRPQRLQCFIALLTGLLAVNAAVHSHPGSIQEAQEFVITGLLSGLLVFPIFCGLVMMFNLRPAQVKKRLIKRAYSTKEIDKLNEQRQRLANQSTMLPPPGYMANPPPVSGTPGNTTLLSLPAPLPLPVLPPGMVGTHQHLQLPPAVPGLGANLALPAVPGMSGRLPLPPPPKYPPPPKNASTATPAGMLPPLSWPTTGPPPTPFPLLQDASMGGTSQLPMRSLPGTGEAPDASMADHEMQALPDPHVLEDAKHTMAPELPGSIGRGPPGPGFGTPGGGSGTPKTGTPRSFGPSQPGTPSNRGPGPPLPGMPGVGGFPGTPGASRNASPRNRSGPPSSRGPGPPLPMVPAENGPMPLFIRGQPPPQLPSPFQGPPGGVPAGGPPPGPPGGFQAMASAGGVPMVPPAPPPPPREDDQAFVRRIRMTYMDKVTKDHDKHDLLEDLEELGKETPGWVYDTMTIMPYLASSTFTLASIFVVLQYGMKFQTFQEEMWWKGSLIGLGLVLGILDLVRVIMMTLVELRKYENRRKAKDGHFLPRKIRRENDKDFQPAPPPRLWKQAVAAPAVPKGPAITAPPPRPAFLPPNAPLAPQIMAGKSGASTPPPPPLPASATSKALPPPPPSTTPPNYSRPPSRPGSAQSKASRVSKASSFRAVHLAQSMG